VAAERWGYDQFITFDDPDPAFHFDAVPDPDPNFQFDAYPDRNTAYMQAFF
jgi:hypothetical protein